MKVGTIEISSKDSANNAFKNPPKENKIEVEMTTKILKGQLATERS